MPQTDPPTILLVGPDEALKYLMERYAQQAQYRLEVAHPGSGWEAMRPVEPAVMWFASLESLDRTRPRERALIADETPVVVCGASSDWPRARELGADHCARHPLTFAEFQAALSSVGLRDSAPGRSANLAV